MNTSIAAYQKKADATSKSRRDAEDASQSSGTDSDDDAHNDTNGDENEETKNEKEDEKKEKKTGRKSRTGGKRAHDDSEDEDDSDTGYEQGHFTADHVGGKVMGEYIQSSLADGRGNASIPPLPVLTKITAAGSLPLINYQMNASNTRSFATALSKIVPKVLRKLYMINTSMKDADIELILTQLSLAERGLITLGIAQNAFGRLSYLALANQLLPNKAFRSVRKLVLKDPNPFRKHALELGKVCAALVHNSSRLLALRKLQLSRLGLDSHGAEDLGRAVTAMPNLQ